MALRYRLSGAGIKPLQNGVVIKSNCVELCSKSPTYARQGKDQQTERKQTNIVALGC